MLDIGLKTSTYCSRVTKEQNLQPPSYAAEFKKAAEAQLSSSKAASLLCRVNESNPVSFVVMPGYIYFRIL